MLRDTAMKSVQPIRQRHRNRTTVAQRTTAWIVAAGMGPEEKGRNEKRVKEKTRKDVYTG